MAGTWRAPPGWYSLRKRVFAAKGRVCWWCGGAAATVDHVFPVFLGGGHEMSNLVPACGRCNSSRGAAMGNRLRPRLPGRRNRGVSRAQPQRPGRRW